MHAYIHTYIHTYKDTPKSLESWSTWSSREESLLPWSPEAFKESMKGLRRCLPFWFLKLLF